MKHSEIPYAFHKGIVLRTPSMPMSTKITRDIVLEFFKDPFAKEALSLASVSLCQTYERWLNGEVLPERDLDKMVYALARYYYRMHLRSTPFGLFAGVSSVEWSENGGELVLDELTSSIRKNRMDMYTACQIKDELCKHPEVLDELLFFPNSTIYEVGEDIRYIEYTMGGELRNHQISAVGKSEYVALVLECCKNGATIKQMVDALAEYEIEPDEAYGFIHDLHQAQILLDELEPNVTGPHYFERIVQVLARIEAEKPSPIVEKWNKGLAIVSDLLQQLGNTLTDRTGTYPKMADVLRGLGIDVVETKMIQTDLWRPMKSNQFDNNLQAKFLDLLVLLNKMQPPRVQSNWKEFIKKFEDRYETKEMPLMEILDDELGIGFGDAVNQDDNPITRDILLPPGIGYGTTEWDAVQTMLLNKIFSASIEKDYSIQVHHSEISGAAPTWERMPASMSIIFRQVADGKIWVDTVGNASAANLINRFSHLHDDIGTIARDICQTEQETNPDFIFAEVVHLSGSRVGNIMIRPSFRPYEIVFLATSNSSPENQIPLSDLYVSIKNGRVMLRSKKLNKYIIPKLTNAHNFHFYTQPLYKFLCDLQNQDMRFFLTFSLGSIGTQMLFTPRIEMDNLILSPATWLLTHEIIAPVIEATTDEERVAKMAKIKENLRMPRYLALIEADTEMIVDLEDGFSLAVLADDIRIRSQIIFKEWLMPDDSIVKDGQGRSYMNQFICSLLRTSPVYTDVPWLGNRPAPVAVQRSFIPGDQWLYYKIYSGVKSVDSILLDAVHPLAQQLKAKGLMDKWFFIRYNDPENHLRLRLHITDPSCFSEANNLLLHFLSPFLQSGQIWKVQMDTYQREIERYGAGTIEHSERLFDADSTATLFFLKNMFEASNGDSRWLWAMRSTDLLLDALGFNLEHKTGLLQHLKTGFAREFRMEDNTLYLKQLSKKYRDNKHFIGQYMGIMEPDDSLIDQVPYWNEALALHERLVKPVCADILMYAANAPLEVSIEYLAASYIHMKFNRIFPSYQRKHEMVLYDLLHQSYKSAKHLSKVLT
jgi:lantibiotic biosynthesis protein